MQHEINALETIKMERIPTPIPPNQPLILPALSMPEKCATMSHTTLYDAALRDTSPRGFRVGLMLCWLVLLVCWLAFLFLAWRWL